MNLTHELRLLVNKYNAALGDRARCVKRCSAELVHAASASCLSSLLCCSSVLSLEASTVLLGNHKEPTKRWVRPYLTHITDCKAL